MEKYEDAGYARIYTGHHNASSVELFKLFTGFGYKNLLGGGDDIQRVILLGTQDLSFGVVVRFA